MIMVTPASKKVLEMSVIALKGGCGLGVQGESKVLERRELASGATIDDPHHVLPHHSNSTDHLAKYFFHSFTQLPRFIIFEHHVHYRTDKHLKRITEGAAANESRMVVTAAAEARRRRYGGRPLLLAFVVLAGGGMKGARANNGRQQQQPGNPYYHPPPPPPPPRGGPPPPPHHQLQVSTYCIVGKCYCEG